MRAQGSRLISPLVGEMSPKATEGGAAPPALQSLESSTSFARRSALPPSVLPDISPLRGEIGRFGAGAR
jgi:hypothetical protein